MQKKGISGVTIAILGLVMLIIGIVIWSSFASAGIKQIPPLTQKIESATGDIPCMKGPTITISPVTQIIPTQKEAKQLADPSGKTVNKNVTFKPSITSSCFENLTIAWVFNETDDKQTEIETECAAPYTLENCSIINHTYELRGIFDLWKVLPVKVSAFGTRSGFYTQSETTAFVNDPYFSISEPIVDMSDFSCVKLTTTLKTLGLNPNPIFSVTDDGKARDVEQVKSKFIQGKGQEYSMVYGASKTIKEHTVKLSATQGYQTTPLVENEYTPENLVEKPEFAVYSNLEMMNIYNSNFQDASSDLDFKGEFFPNVGIYNLAIGDLDNDLTADFAFIGNDYLFALPFSVLKTSMAQNFRDMKLERLIQYWPNKQISVGGVYWRAVSTGKNIKGPDGQTGNIVILGNPGDLDLYKYEYGSIRQIEPGRDFKDSKIGEMDAFDWDDVTTADVDNDGESEIIAIRGWQDYGTGDMYIFKYAKYKDVDNKKPYWVNIPNKNWFAAAAGHFNGNPKTVEIAAVGGGALSFVMMDSSGKYAGESDITNWPADVNWIDAVMANVDNDAAEELILLYEQAGTYKVLTFGPGAALTLDFGNSINNANFTKLPELKTYSLTAGKAATAIAAGDFACI
jgi:hypothetical protein